jgi:glutathione S-transferase
LFETGAIVLHIAERHAALWPDDEVARARLRGLDRNVPKRLGELAASLGIDAYLARGERRPAFKRAFDAQLGVYDALEMNSLS